MCSTLAIDTRKMVNTTTCIRYVHQKYIVCTKNTVAVGPDKPVIPG